MARELKIVVFHEKHGDRYVRLPSDGARAPIMRKIFQEREKDGFYDEEDMDKKHVPIYERALKSGKEQDDEAVMTFMNLRSKYEYEGFEIVTVEEI